MATPTDNPSIRDLSMLGGHYSPLALIERERHVLSEIANGVPLRTVLDGLLRAVETQSGNTMMTSVLVLSEDGQTMHHGAAPSLPADYNKAIDGISAGEGIGSCGTAVARGLPVYVTQIATDPLWKDFVELALGFGLHACWSMPIIAADARILGTFAIYYREPRAPTPGDIEAITVITQTAALAIERHRSDLQLRRSREELLTLNAELEQKVNERARERSRTWQLSPDLMSVLGAEGVFEASNPAWSNALGWSAEELRAPYSQFVHPEDLASTVSIFTQAMAGQPILKFENRYQHRDGSYRWLSWVAVLEEGRLYCSARDVTLEKHQSAILDMRTRERDRAWGLSQELLVIVRPDGIFESVNGRWTELLGWEEPELLGHAFMTFTHPDDLAPTIAAFQGIFGAPLTVPYEYRLRHKDGSWRWFSWTGTYEDGRVYAAGRHMTVERAQAEALRQSQKMEAVGQLTGGVAHDFNNLLTVIRSSTDLLKRPNLTEERRSRYVNAISDTVDRAARLTGQLLAFARRQALKPEVFAACNGVRGIGQMMGTLAGARVELVMLLPATPCRVNADPNQFETALVNMVANARDAMEGEGRLTITVEAVEHMPAVRLHTGVADPFVAVSISDTGMGIPADKLEHIFEPFFTTKGVGQGTGLGLSQVFGFAKQSGGEVVVSSEVGRGTTFILYLPRVAQVIHTIVPVSEPEALADGHGTRVLVVEDNPDVGTFATQTLAELGYITVLAVNADEALNALVTHQGRFDVVFSDVVMPGMSGIELGHEIRRLHPDLPVLLTSGYSHVLAQNGTYGFELLHKPYSVEQLSRTLRKVVELQRRSAAH
ncbi:PAS domain-containing protein [Pseudomonas sp. dw_358]|uniref:PAS domain-containing protein n=1 Tax=Pseudomonas sp. dw_358 TaxID=2720083 RepID=UPI001BD2E806|nr:PAS domain-containing protein [Pseudomonas sp. dw_358]